MSLNVKADKFKQSHQLNEGDKIAFHYGEPSATVVQKVTGKDHTVLIIHVPNDEPVRYRAPE